MTVLQPVVLRQIGQRRRDPTRSVALRKHARTLVNARVYELNRNLRSAFLEHDLPNLKGRGEQALPSSLARWVEPDGSRLERSEEMLRQMVEMSIASPANWMGEVIGAAVDRGVAQASVEMRALLGSLDVSEVSRLLTTITGQEVRGISSETQRRLLRNVAKSLENNQSPFGLMKEVRKTLEKVTRQRLIVLVNTTMVKAVNAGKLAAYRANGVKRVGIEPEWLPKMISRDSRHHWSDEAMVNVLTAGDDDVCEECQDIAESGPYEIDEAGGLIPAHPNCRCAFVPVDDERFAESEEVKEAEEWIEREEEKERDDDDDDDDDGKKKRRR